MNTRILDVLVIGAGQAGLTSAYYLRKTNLSFLLVDKNNEIGKSWKERYDSLKLLTVNANNSLPGFPIDNPTSFPTKDEYADYLKRYAKHFHFPIELNRPIKKLSIVNNLFLTEGYKEKYIAKNIIIATGAFQKPYIPPFSKSVSPNLLQIHSAFYRNPKQVPKGRILVVGGGVSGVQIAVELSDNHPICVSAREKIIFGNRYDALYRFAANFFKPTQLRKITNLLSVKKIYSSQFEEMLKNKELQLKPVVVNIDGQKAIFKDGTQMEFDSVIWATGFSLDFNWIEIPNIFSKKGEVITIDGVSKQSGLYFIYFQNKEFAFIKDLPSRTEYIISRIKNNAT